MQCVEDDHGNGGGDDLIRGRGWSWDVKAITCEDGPTIGNVDFHEQSSASSGMHLYIDLDIQNGNIEVNSLVRVDLIEDEIET